MSSKQWTTFIPKSGREGSSFHEMGNTILLHFFPTALGVSAPYAVKAKIELFIDGAVFARQSFDGLRLNQPDGLELGKIFPEVHFSSEKEIGVNIELEVEKGRVDLSHSRICLLYTSPSPRD